MSREIFAPQVIYRTGDSGRNQPMDISEIRRRNLLALIDDETAKNGYRGARTRLAQAIDRTPDFISRWTAGKPIGNDISRHIEKCLSLPAGWMDERHDAPLQPAQPANDTNRLRIDLIQYISSAPEMTIVEIARLLHMPLRGELHGSRLVGKLTDDDEP